MLDMIHLALMLGILMWITYQMMSSLITVKQVRIHQVKIYQPIIHKLTSIIHYPLELTSRGTMVHNGLHLLKVVTIHASSYRVKMEILLSSEVLL